MLWTVAKEAASNWSSHRDSRQGAALAYYSVFSLGPIIVIAIAVAGFFFGREAVSGQVASSITGMLGETGAKAVDFQPSVTVALSEDCRLQARIDVVTRTNSYQVRTGDFSDDVISVYLILRRYWGDRPKEPMEKIMSQMAERGEQLCNQYIVPRVLKPISSAIASRS